jgi:hypothetical protein
MFYLLALVLCLAVVFIVLACATVLCGAGSWAARRAINSLTPRTGAAVLFTMRTLPLFLALVVTLGFALPAFLRFEPRSSGELIGLRLLGLATLGALLITVLAARTCRILAATHRARRQWLKDAERLQSEGIDVPVYCADDECPLLAVTGLFRPSIFVSRKVTQNLSAGELSAAIAHEMAHVSALDNLKQLFLKITRPPQWVGVFGKSEGAWVNVSEIAADEGALASGASALDLSSALVKVGRLSRQRSATPMIAASHLLPIALESSMEIRIAHLEKLLGKENGERAGDVNPGGRRRWRVLTVLLLVAGYALCLNAILPWMHETLEILVK